MSRFRFREIRLENYRCFDELTLPLEEDTTVLFAENGGGKTALLTALAMGLAVVQPGAPRNPEARRAKRPPDAHARREGATGTGRCVQGRVDRGRGRIGIRHVVDGGSARVRTRQESTPGALRCPGAGADARRAVAAVCVVRRRSPGPPPRPAPQGRADGGPMGSLRLRARPEPRRGPAAAVAQGRDGRRHGPEAARRTGALLPHGRDGSDGPGDTRRHPTPGTTRRRKARWCASRTGTPPRGPSCPTAITCSSR